MGHLRADLGPRATLTEMVEIVVLAERTELIPVVAGWQYNTWGLGYPGGSLAVWTDFVRERAGGIGIPMTWVALVDGRPVGCVGLLASEMATHMDLSPWLSSLYVMPEQRGRGVGGSLVRHCEGAAWRLGVDPLYAYATTTVASLYVGLGWRQVVTERYRDEEVTVLAKDAPL